MAVEVKRMKASPQWWWFDSYSSKDTTTTPKRSPWLQSTLADLDEKTKAMLRIIEEDADSFAQRAEMYYKKRPELITMVEDFYRAHRSLAERFDQAKSDAGFRVITPLASSSPLSSFKYRQEKPILEKSYDIYSETYDDHVESDESEVDDPEQEDESEVDDPEQEEEEDRIGEENEEEVSSDFVNDEMMRLRNEVERLKEENRIQKEQITEKDEEKREVIRQLSLAMDVLREENVKLRNNKCRSARESPKKWNPAEFWGKLFNGSSKSQATSGGVVP